MALIQSVLVRSCCRIPRSAASRLRPISMTWPLQVVRNLSVWSPHQCDKASYSSAVSPPGQAILKGSELEELSEPGSKYISRIYGAHWHCEAEVYKGRPFLFAMVHSDIRARGKSLKSIQRISDVGGLKPIWRVVSRSLVVIFSFGRVLILCNVYVASLRIVMPIP
jgi:hypothetical protein